MSRHPVFWILNAVVVFVLVLPLSAAVQKQKTQKRKRRPNAAFARVTDDPKLPRVLLIGDSISIGYTVPCRSLLKGRANLHRIPTNGGPTTRGLQSIDRWLGKSRWDVIHFNWGLHDLKYIGKKKQVSLSDYEKNLRKLVARLKATKATLIWCSTTPVPSGVRPTRKNSEVLEYNAVAKKIMQENGIAIHDLYQFANSRLQKIQRPKNVHFNPAGSKQLAEQVVRNIEAALKK
ncbi:MAG: SGNH/GDSL hydrolase family protein [Planctomycetes bacterium]|nr:SGNH/GDSL hydrolase family protein [Planctomycetota bacterium]